MPNNPSSFGKALKEIRDKRGWSQSEMAARLGIQKEVVSHYETGWRQFPSVKNLLLFADKIPTSILKLLGRSPERY